jgi:hypothetical protein
LKREATKLKELESSRVLIEQLRVKRAELDSQIRSLEEEHEAAFMVGMTELTKRLGIAKLPYAKVVAALQGLALQTGPMDVPDKHDDVVVEGMVDIFVRLSANTSAAKRRALGAAGLRWNGRVGRWTGKVSASKVESLRAMFGDRVESPTLTGKMNPTALEEGMADDASPVSAADPEPPQVGDEPLAVQRSPEPARQQGGKLDAAKLGDVPTAVAFMRRLPLRLPVNS